MGERKFCGPEHDRIALRVAEKIEDEFARGHPGGRGQRTAAVQVVIIDLMEELMAGFVGRIAWEAAAKQNGDAQTAG